MAGHSPRSLAGSDSGLLRRTPVEWQGLVSVASLAHADVSGKVGSCQLRLDDPPSMGVELRISHLLVESSFQNHRRRNALNLKCQKTLAPRMT